MSKKTPIRTYTNAANAAAALKQRSKKPTVVFAGDCLQLIEAMPDNSVSLTISSPPYHLGKAYDDSRSMKHFLHNQRQILPEIVRVTKPGGSICWQVGFHVNEARTREKHVLHPLDYYVFDIMNLLGTVTLRNRIIWTYNHGLHAVHRFSGRHETVLWFTKDGADYTFDLDAVRTPQKYPGKRVYKGARKGQFSGNPLGKNPSDVWDIPNVKAMHIEKLKHPCQFPVGLADRLVRALSKRGDVVFDPYMGTATTGVAALLNARRFVGAEISQKYIDLCVPRLRAARDGTVKYRPAERAIFVAHDGLAVARRPPHFHSGAPRS